MPIQSILGMGTSSNGFIEHDSRCYAYENNLFSNVVIVIERKCLVLENLLTFYISLPSSSINFLLLLGSVAYISLP